MVIWCWRNAYYFTFFLCHLFHLHQLISFDHLFVEKRSAKTNKKCYCKWLPYYNQMIFVPGNLLFVKNISWSPNDHNWALYCCIEAEESHIFLTAYLILLSISLMICKSVSLLLNFETMLPILIAHHIAAVAVPEYTHHNKFRQWNTCRNRKIRIRRKTIKK